MKTTQALAELTDAGQFERIATSVLRYAEPEIYGNVSHQGVNPQGKTIKAPLDNVGWYQDTNMIVCIAHTTTSKGDLEPKWLRDLDEVKPRKKGTKPTGTDGDLVKAIKEINRIRETNPNIKARIALAINCEESQGLRAKVETLASNNNIELDVWSVSRLADFLDINPDGQIIRRNHFGIPPIRLSKQLLLEIGAQSLSNLNFDNELFIERNLETIHQNTLVVGVSGTGKTTYCINILNRHLEIQKPVLVITDSTINQAISIEEAIDIELRRYVNELIPQSGHQALKFCSIDEPLIILVEDINRSSDSMRLLRKLIDWSNNNANFTLLCPVWHRLIAGLSFEEKKSLDVHFKIEYLESYNENEASNAIIARATKERIRIDELSAANIAQQLGYDPLLISLANLAEFHEKSNIIEEYVQDTIQCIATRNDFLSYEVEEAVNEYGLYLFKNKKVQGESQDLRSLSQSSKKAFKQVLTDGRLFRQTFGNQDCTILARHDRLNFYVIAKSIVSYLEDADFDLTDPYFAEIIGIACVLAEIDKQRLYQISIKNSLVAFHCYAFAAKTNSRYIDIAINNVKQWLLASEHQSDLYDARLYKSLVILNDVFHISLPEILILYNDKHHNYLFNQIGFKHGNLSNGLRWISTYHFDANISGEKQIIDHVFNKYGENLLNQICIYLIDENTSYIVKHQLLRLIGYTENTIFANPIRTAWRLIPDEKKDYRIFFWAAARVCDDNPHSLLEPIFDYWENLSDENNEYMSEKAQFATYSLGFKFRDYIPRRSISYIIQQAYKRPSLFNSIFSMLRDVDHPEVLEFQAKHFSDIEKKDDSNFGFTMFTSFFKSDDYQVLSNASKERLLFISNHTEDDILRKKSFELLEKSSNIDDLVILQQITKDDIRFETALMGRAKRQDVTVVDDLIEKINTDPVYWWQATRYIWSEKLEQLFEEKISQIHKKTDLDDLWMIDELFEKVEIKKAEELLIKYWEELSGYPKFIQIALMLATLKLQELVAEKLKNESNVGKYFQLIQFTLGIKTHGRKGIYNYEQMKALEPYFAYIDEYILSELSEICLKHRWMNIVQAIAPLITDKRFRRSVEIDKSNLDSALHENNDFVYLWISDRKEEGWTHQETIDALFEWFENHKSIEALNIIIEPLGESGKRSDFLSLKSILEHIDNLSNKEEVLNILHFDIYSRSLE